LTTTTFSESIFEREDRIHDTIDVDFSCDAAHFFIREMFEMMCRDPSIRNNNVNVILIIKINHCISH